MERRWILDRYLDGRKMAEGASVRADSLDEAVTRARHLFAEYDQRRLRFEPREATP